MTDVVLDGVDKVYPGGQAAVRNVRLRINDGELFVLLGPSGCGKSTILRMIAGLEEITSGDLWLNGIVANGLPPRERNVAMVFQEGALYPHRTVKGNMMFPLEVSGDDRAEASAKVVELARALGINTMIDRMPRTLSGGQRQRAAIGRALIREPSLFLMDEPLSSLDAGLRAELRVEIAALVRSTGTTTVYVTHDQIEAMTMADRMAVLRDGVLEDVGTPEQIYEDPATVFVAAFLSSPPINLLQATLWAVEGEGLLLDFGPQRLTLPWNDPRASALISHHGRPVIVGIRPDTLMPIAPGSPAPHGSVLSGQVRALEFHGHEWLAYAEAGIPTVDATEVGRPEAPPAREPDRPGLRGRLRGVFGRPSGEEEYTEEHAGHHRRSDLVFRIAPGGRPDRGDHVALTIDFGRVLFFGADGRRVTPVQR
ncbi:MULTISPECIES: ABC transporter ATP-binding protein [Actinomadura]|uniref:Multiple sugar transport system ATP-binding protein n=1 Tax=Actinomadura madurae TaxID=1993 RepID=A0A1I4WQI2_9ACTN|nr:ATP-binding cassette domain-containing protein [Actinomadura madurae]SFN15279.1 multiple sugar transport system ATP-binding protein [Actinomadura madurae]SPT63033.1 sn-glycerol-3-phosphate import ATP-binding protein UgpC [Actinomadura madurae]